VFGDDIKILDPFKMAKESYLIAQTSAYTGIEYGKEV